MSNPKIKKRETSFSGASAETAGRTGSSHCTPDLKKARFRSSGNVPSQNQLEKN